jgi:hypothetical protein
MRIPKWLHIETPQPLPQDFHTGGGPSQAKLSHGDKNRTALIFELRPWIKVGCVRTAVLDT